MDSLVAFFGTYTNRLPHVDGKGRGIYRARFDATTGELSGVTLAAEQANPTYLALAPNKRTLYAVSEIDEFEGEFGGSLSAYAIDPSTQALTLLNREPTRGAFPCHVAVDTTSQTVIVANYGSGSKVALRGRAARKWPSEGPSRGWAIAIFPTDAAGRLKPASDLVKLTGSGPNPERQQGPHAHHIGLSPDNRFVLVNDLGTDSVLVYQFDTTKGPHASGELKLTPNPVAPLAKLSPGAGPRHLDFHPSGKYVYVINELDATITVFAYDAVNGALENKQTLSTLPPGWSGVKSCAAVRVHPSGKFVYGSNRGHDSIALFAIAEATGMLTTRGHVSTQGKEPRDFAIDPSGRFLLAENQDTGTVVSFQIDPVHGSLTPTGHVAHVPTPVCLTFLT